MAQSPSMRSETTPCFGNLNVMSACESVVETMEAESLFVSSSSFNISLFHVFSASHENRLAMSKPGRFQKCASGARNPLRKLTGVKTIQDTTPRIPPIVCFSKHASPRGKEDFWDTGASVQTGWRHFANKTSVLRKNRNSHQMIDWLRKVSSIEPKS